MAYSLGRSAGMAVGIIVGIIILFFLLKFINSDKKLATRYDEKQIVERGKGYKYGFYAVLIYEALMCLIDNGALPLTGFMIHFLAIIIGALVQVSYCIWHDAYMGLNNNGRRYAAVLVVIALFNFFIGFMAIRSGEMLVNGVLQAQFANLICGVICLLIGVELFLKKTADAKEEE